MATTIKTYDNQTIHIDEPLEGNLIALPALIDPHVHFRTPGSEYKEDWITGAQAAFAGGVSTVFDMPNNQPATINEQNLKDKIALINNQLHESKLDLKYKLWFGATPNNLAEIEKAKNYDEVIGIKVFMGSSTGDLLVDKEKDQAQIFKLAHELNLPVAVHAEDEELIKIQDSRFKIKHIHDHSKIRNAEVAKRAVHQAIELADKYKTKLYILHVSTADEIELIRQAKDNHISVFCEVTPHHLFLTVDDYDTLGCRAQMNPPLRTLDHQDALWDAILDGVVDTIGTDHAPHSLEEKMKQYGQAPSGVPGIETSLPLLLDAYNHGKISLDKIVELTSTNQKKIFNLENNDWVIVDLDLEKQIKNENLKTKCKWSPFAGKTLKGWPILTILNNKNFYL